MNEKELPWWWSGLVVTAGEEIMGFEGDGNSGFFVGFTLVLLVLQAVCIYTRDF